LALPASARSPRRTSSSRTQGRGGRDTVAIHPICHRTLHKSLTNKALEKIGADVEALRTQPGIVRFLAWIANKDPDFHAPTR